MSPSSQTSTNRREGSDGDDGWGDSSIELTPPAPTCECHCDGGCCGNCGCRSCFGRVDHVLAESNQAVYPGQGGLLEEAVPSQPMRIPVQSDDAELSGSFGASMGLQNNSVEASSLPLTHENLGLFEDIARSLPDGRHGPATGWRGGSIDECPLVMARRPGMEHVIAVPDFDDISLEESMIVEQEHTSLHMSMLSDWSHTLTRSSPSASVYLTGLKHSYVRTPLRLVPECTHAQTLRCGCYCRM